MSSFFPMFAAAWLVAANAHAQPAGIDPPGRVARLADIGGSVWINRVDSPEWIAAARNQPLTSGDRLATDPGGRAELSVGSTTLRLDSASELEVVHLDDGRFAVQLRSGSVAARLRSSQSLAEFELDTDEGRFRALRIGRYRFDRFEPSSFVTVEAGQAVFEGRGSALPVQAGQHTEFWLDSAGAPQYEITAPVRDWFTAWNDERDRAEERAATSRYVSPEMTGAQDLDRYGAWEQDPEYGAVWTPRGVAVDWAPYSSGHWSFVRPWGWTWIDDAAWGFAPFHYGRWVYRRQSWCWAPGTYVARPIYAPALVAWLGGPRGGPSVGVGSGGPAVGWFPLGPREVYVPSYHASRGYVRNINVTQVTNVVVINNIIDNRGGVAERRDFGNRKFPNAVTVVPASVLVDREPVRVGAGQFRDSPSGRALINQPQAPVFISAPVAAPPVPVRGTEPRRGPPGFVLGPAAPFGPDGSTADRRERPRGGQPERGGFGRSGGPYPAPAMPPPVGPAVGGAPPAVVPMTRGGAITPMTPVAPITRGTAPAVNPVLSAPPPPIDVPGRDPFARGRGSRDDPSAADLPSRERFQRPVAPSTGPAPAERAMRQQLPRVEAPAFGEERFRRGGRGDEQRAPRPPESSAMPGPATRAVEPVRPPPVAPMTPIAPIAPIQPPRFQAAPRPPDAVRPAEPARPSEVTRPQDGRVERPQRPEGPVR